MAELKFSVMTGFFLSEFVQPGDFDPFQCDLGLMGLMGKQLSSAEEKVRAEQWSSFSQHIQDLDDSSPATTRYKLLYLARHGQGVHNVAESTYGTAKWESHYAKLDGAAGIGEWIDAPLTPEGIRQAKDASNFWLKFSERNITALPQSYYVSPLDRCLATARLTFGPLQLPKDRPYKPVVKEMLRETMGVHTCDKRRSRSYIEKTYPEVTIAEPFAEEDTLWNAHRRETNQIMDFRFRGLLRDIFKTDNNTHISLTAHSGAIASILRVLGHATFRLKTGSVMAVFVKAENVQ